MELEARPPTLAVQLAGTTSLGTFVPGVARDYTAGLNATVTSTGGDSKLTVSDASTTNTGKLVNGTHALAQPLQVRAGTAAFAPIGGSAARPACSTSSSRSAGPPCRSSSSSPSARARVCGPASTARR